MQVMQAEINNHILPSQTGERKKEEEIMRGIPLSVKRLNCTLAVRVFCLFIKKKKKRKIAIQKYTLLYIL